MRLLQPNPGECVDRQTILEIKMAFAEKKKLLRDGTGAINTTHLVAEHRAIQSYLEKEWFKLVRKDLSKPYDELLLQLKQVNQRLWNLEDEIREYRKSPSRWPDKQIAACAFAIAEQNDLRATLVARINALFGINTQEKMYL